MLERRLESRLAAPLLLNKYVAGQPYFCHVRDISFAGARLVRTVEPDLPRGMCSLEIGLPDGTIWVWARHVWTRGREQAMQFVGMDALDERRLSTYLRGSC
jgi:hypothetical protein